MCVSEREIKVKRERFTFEMGLDTAPEYVLAFLGATLVVRQMEWREKDIERRDSHRKREKISLERERER